MDACVVFRGRSMTGWISVQSETPIYEVGNVFVFANREDGNSVSFVAPTTLVGVIAEEETAGDGGQDRRERVKRVSCARWKKDPVFPVILEYRHGRTAFVCKAQSGEIIVSCGGSAIDALGVHCEVTDVMPERLRRDFCNQAQMFRRRLVEHFAEGGEESLVGERTPAAVAALEKLGEKGGRLVYAQGELGEYSIWGFAEGEGDFCVVGVAEKMLTLTLLFPFLAWGREYEAEWQDDGLDYYVKGDLSVRPRDVRGKTKAVVKTSDCGGFVLRLCLKR